MASVRSKPRKSGGASFVVRWREGGGRQGAMQYETFSIGAEAVCRRKAEDFAAMVTQAGERWPEGWTKGRGFVRPGEELPESPEASTRLFTDIGLEYVNQIVDIEPAQRTRYRNQLTTLAEIELPRSGRFADAVPGEKYQPFAGAVADIVEADIKLWLIHWDRALKTKANYHGLIFGVLNYALEHGLVTELACRRTAPKRSKIRADRADLRFLTEEEFGIAQRDAAEDIRDLVITEAGTGMRWGEISALWVTDVDPRNSTVRINKAWKREGDDGEQRIPGWLRKAIREKHGMRQHYLGNPKTTKSKRTIKVSPSVMAALQRACEGKALDDFVFTTATGLPWHQSEFYENRWLPLLGMLAKAHVAPLRFHDLRHSHVAWLIAGGVPLPHIQARLGHESIVTTIDTYGHLLPQGDELIDEIVETVLKAQRIRALRLVASA